jgi:catechol 2,3-dioxygenase-like lactoylglutathione lyase family enzyme
MRITHLVCWVQENKLSEKFYRKLGFSVTQSDEEHSMVVLGNFGLDLVSMRDDNKFSKDSMAAEKGLGLYIYLRVDDVDAKYAEIVALGLQPTKPKDWEWGNREFILRDPDGYKLCFWQTASGHEA